MKKFFEENKNYGSVLLLCTFCSLLFSNLPFSQLYNAIWNTQLIDYQLLPTSLIHIFNDGLMTVFFFFAALEIKRELVSGELNSLKKALMPLFSATGGMLVPAAIYLLFCHQKTDFSGWGIPMATDIAFSLAILSLVGKKAPLSLRIFLTAIAIIDDIGGIITITLFYPGQLHLSFLFAAIAIVLLLVIFHLKKVKSLATFIAAGLVLWFFVYNSGINTSIAGVITAFAIPVAQSKSLINKLYLPVNLVVLPLFALANTAFSIPADIGKILQSTVHLGVFFGLALGKPLGIFAFAQLASALKIAELPRNTSVLQLLGVGTIAGIGFTVSLFITPLAFADPQLQISARLAIVNASLISGFIGFCLLRFSKVIQPSKHVIVHH